MSREINEFLNTGLQRYKEAHDVYWHFREEIKSILNSIISDRENFGKLVINPESTVFRQWSNGLQLTSRVWGVLNGRKFSIGIGIDWGYENANKPIPFAWIEDENLNFLKLHSGSQWHNTRYNKNQQLGYFKDFRIEELEAIYNELLDELVAYLNQLNLEDN